MTVTSKEIIMIILEIAIGIIITLLIPRWNIDIESLKDSIITISVAIITASAIIILVYKKLNEVDEELTCIKKEQEKLGEKLKIHEQLIDMKVEIKELQKKVFKK